MHERINSDRQFSQTVIGAISKVIPEFFGGSADLNPSTLTYLDISKDFQKVRVFM